jgi:ferredoxin
VSNRMIYLKGVVTLQLDSSKCSGCGMCAVVCARGVFQTADEKASITARDLCIECGACALNCPSRAISVRTGVGCATAVLNGMLGRTGGACCCSIEQYRPEDGDKAG